MFLFEIITIFLIKICYRKYTYYWFSRTVGLSRSCVYTVWTFLAWSGRLNFAKQCWYAFSPIVFCNWASVKKKTQFFRPLVGLTVVKKKPVLRSMAIIRWVGVNWMQWPVVRSVQRLQEREPPYLLPWLQVRCWLVREEWYSGEVCWGAWTHFVFEALCRV